jgi:hypothetical protein
MAPTLTSGQRGLLQESNLHNFLFVKFQAQAHSFIGCKGFLFLAKVFVPSFLSRPPPFVSSVLPFDFSPFQLLSGGQHDQANLHQDHAQQLCQ